MATKSFDGRGATSDDEPAKVERAKFTADLIRSTLSLDGSERFLEYGAGIGSLFRAPQANVRSLVSADALSAGTSDVIQSKREDDRLPASTEI